MRLGFDGAPDGMPHIDLAPRTAQGFIQRDHDVALDVRAPFGKITARRTARLPEAGRPTPRAAEDLLEEITETGAAKVRFKILGAHPATAAKRLTAGPMAETGRRPELGPGFPVGAQFVEFFPLGGIAEHLVGFVDLLEL